MADYYVEKKMIESGEHLVHTATCSSLPAIEGMHYMGSYAQPPLWEARIRYAQVSTCPNCLPG